MSKMKIIIDNGDIIQRNPVAAVFSTGKFKKQVVKDRKKYSRKMKHKGLDIAR